MAQGKKFTPYDPAELVSLSVEQHPDKEWLHKALAECTQGSMRSDGAYIEFVEAGNLKWETNVYLHSVSDGMIILDIFEKNIIGGVEFTFLLGPRSICNCGYVFDYQSTISNLWDVTKKTNYREIKELKQNISTASIEEKRALRKVLRRLQETIFQCPECSRIMWYKPGETLFQVFAPESILAK